MSRILLVDDDADLRSVFREKLEYSGHEIDEADSAEDALAKGTGVASAEFMPGVRLVRAFNAISYRAVDSDAHLDGDLIGIPIAGDDQEALRVVSDLVVDAGFDPVVVGSLADGRKFDQGSSVYVQDMTAAQLREALVLEWRPLQTRTPRRPGTKEPTRSTRSSSRLPP